MARLIKRLLMIVQVLRHRDGAAKVVFYHDVGKAYTSMGTDAHMFWRHMHIFCEDNANRASCARHKVCFDDGFRGIWDCREELKQQGLRPMVFLAVRLIGLPGYLTRDEILLLQRDYGFDFECHAWSHQTLAGPMIDESPMEDRTEAWYDRELVASKSELEKMLGKTVNSICLPVGNFSGAVLRRCKRAGYDKVYMSYPGNICEKYVQPRNLVQDMSAFDFKLALNGGLMALFDRYYKLHKFED